MKEEMTAVTEKDTIISMLCKSAEAFSKRPALKVKDNGIFRPVSYRQLYELIEAFGSGLIRLGLKKDDHIGLISDNRMEWLVSDMAILGTGGVDVPRGSCSNEKEIEYILEHSDAKAVVLENSELFGRLKEIIRNKLHRIKTVIVLEEGFSGDSDLKAYSFDDVLELGRGLLKKDPNAFRERAGEVGPEDLATIIYTSGTTGEPKGVMLTHGNIMHNVRVAPPLFNIKEEDSFLSILFPWHIYERTLEYMVVRCGGAIIYSKPVRQIILEDIQLERPSFMVGVPRIWEGLYKGILNNANKQTVFKRNLFHISLAIAKKYARAKRIIGNNHPVFKKQGMIEKKVKKLTALIIKAVLSPFYQIADRSVFSQIKSHILGGRLFNLISGGAALPASVDEFFEAIGIPILEGYGLTETSPVVCTRRHDHRTIFTIGPPLPEVEIKITDKKNQTLSPGEVGLLKIRGPLIMKGYYKKEDLTARVIDSKGWFNSGDLAMTTVNGEVRITGRAKDTIVLLCGQNVEPAPIEGKLKESPYISQAVVVGQDKKHLGVLLIPDFEAIRNRKEFPLNSQQNSAIVKDRRVIDLLKGEVKRLVSSENGFKFFEKIYRFYLLENDFTVGKELTHTMKIKRDVVQTLYVKEIDSMFRER